SDTSTTMCGAGCMLCTAPSNATPTCNGTCGFNCVNGYHKCNGACAQNTSPMSCGTMSCNACPPPGIANGVATCDGTMCGVGCVAGYALCLNSNGTTNSCAAIATNWDTGSVEGWMFNGGGGVFSTSTQIRHGNSGASLTFNSFLSFQAGVRLPLCNSVSS